MAENQNRRDILEQVDSILDDLIPMEQGELVHEIFAPGWGVNEQQGSSYVVGLGIDLGAVLVATSDIQVI